MIFRYHNLYFPAAPKDGARVFPVCLATSCFHRCV